MAISNHKKVRILQYFIEIVVEEKLWTR